MSGEYLQAVSDRSGQKGVPVHVAAILLAAGESTRMGQLKALLPWPGPEATLLEYQLRQLGLSAVSEVVVVLGYRADELAPLAVGPRVRSVRNPSYPLGKTTSIRAGVAALNNEADAALILGVDQPRPAWLLDKLIGTHRAHPAPITTPAHHGKRAGHPPIFSRALFPELLAISEERAGLREVFERHAANVQLVPVGDPIVRVNLNTPEDYEAALRMKGW